VAHEPKCLSTTDLDATFLFVGHAQCSVLFTLLEPAGFGNFRKKNSSFRLLYQRPSCSADCARELFIGSNGL